MERTWVADQVREEPPPDAGAVELARRRPAGTRADSGQKLLPLPLGGAPENSSSSSGSSLLGPLKKERVGLEKARFYHYYCFG